MPSRARRCGGADDTSTPSSRTAPVQRWTPAIALKVVVLPAPFGPSRPTISPASTEVATSRTARCSPKRTLRSCTSSSAIRAYLSVHRCGELGQGLHQLDVVVLAGGFARPGLADHHREPVREQGDGADGGHGHAEQAAPYEVGHRSEANTSALQSLMRNSYAVSCL